MASAEFEHKPSRTEDFGHIAPAPESRRRTLFAHYSSVALASDVPEGTTADRSY
jgi:hypothetical protein